MSATILRLVVQRIALGLMLLFAVSILLFAGTELLPGDVAQQILGKEATPETLASLRLELGLDQPAYLRYLAWLSGMLQGDLGKELISGRDIGPAISGRLFNTLVLAAWAAAIAVPLSIVLGLISVRYRDGLVDRFISTVALASNSLPEFFLGYVAVYFFAVKWQIFPALAAVYDGMPVMDRIQAVALPGTVLALIVLTHMMRMTRAAVLSVMQSPFIETAKLKGLRPIEIIRRHALPNAIAPITTVIVLELAYLIVGVVVVEIIFGYPGMGQYLVDHVSKRDVPVVQAAGLIFASVYIGLNTVADLIAIVTNPRLRYPR
ncbi:MULTISPECIES: ABC transporter permease [unclassified Mesorhizobium]|uniref:ABC transporter permease n=1 Tax=unclassified Mesorhizobium TaxID=325217 RepID=UPI000FD8626F|nr:MULTISPECIES: ABC transporter permease [unclassified Mesorhizobium]TGT71911.1 ABC transporter permease [Mesorhizobium sp. M2E.F.Ca.ET.166.01.1.1]TGV99374.1 ABC transporter permease [Mesorhizobium sp. M2E.F.Ca.ET.154.01.1.1]